MQRFSDLVAALMGGSLSWAPLCLVRLIIEYSGMEGIEFGPAMLRQMRACDMSGSSLRECTFKEGSLRGVSLAGADLTGSTFLNMNLTGVNLSAALLDKAAFLQCSLLGANMQRVSFSDAILEDTETAYAAFSEGSGEVTVGQLARTTMKRARIQV